MTVGTHYPLSTQSLYSTTAPSFATGVVVGCWCKWGAGTYNNGPAIVTSVDAVGVYSYSSGVKLWTGTTAVDLRAATSDWEYWVIATVDSTHVKVGYTLTPGGTITWVLTNQAITGTVTGYRVANAASSGIIDCEYYSVVTGTMTDAAIASMSNTRDPVSGQYILWRLESGDGSTDSSGNSRTATITGTLSSASTGVSISSTVTSTVAATAGAPTASATASVGEPITSTVAATAGAPTASASGSVETGGPVSSTVAATAGAPAAAAIGAVGQPITSTVAATAGAPTAAIAGTSGTAQLYQCATRCVYPNTLGTSTATFATARQHTIRGAITRMKVRIRNAYADQTGEHLTGGTLTVGGISIEYQGTFHRFTFSGSNSVVVSDGTQIDSDELAISLPDGASVISHRQLTHSTGIPYNDTDRPLVDAALGDRVEMTATDKVMSGGEANSFNFSFGGLALMGDTNALSIAAYGDSRTAGYSETTNDASGNTGEICRAIGGYAAYIQLGFPAETLSSFRDSHAGRIAFADCCNQHLIAYGVNDTVNYGATAADTITALQTVTALLPSGKVWAITLPPWTTGSWGSDTTQTVTANESKRTGYNDTLRAGVSGVRTIELADQAETARNSGKWKFPNWTTDGIHETSYANEQYVITAGTFADTATAAVAATAGAPTSSASASVTVPTATVAATAGAPTSAANALVLIPTAQVVALAGGPQASAMSVIGEPITSSVAAIAGAPVANSNGVVGDVISCIVAAVSGAPISSAAASVALPIAVVVSVAGAPTASSEIVIGEPITSTVTATAGAPTSRSVGAVGIENLGCITSRFAQPKGTTVTLEPIFVDDEEGSPGVLQPFSFAGTEALLTDLTIQNAELEILTGSDCIESTRPFSFVPIDGHPGATWWVRGIKRGIAIGIIWLTLSDGERMPIEFWLPVVSYSG